MGAQQPVVDSLQRPARDTTAAGLAAVVISATRSERRLEDVPLRVEVIDEEEIAEKVAMTPGDIAMMLNETSGLRVQATSPSLGGASVRIQGLAGRYSLLLADGLPLYGGQAGALGLLQIPPLDLGRVEVIKGTASALYGSAALGGVINLLSRRPGKAPEHTVLVNQTSRGGSDAVVFLTAPLSRDWGYTILGGAHRQSRRDLDGDGWVDLAGYDRGVVRPRLFYADDRGRSLFVTGGFAGEDRTGGTLAGRVAPDGRPFPEGLATRRVDAGGVARFMVRDATSFLRGSVVSLRASAVDQRHDHTIGPTLERDRHRTFFTEATAAVPRGRATYVAGVAFQRDEYRARDVPGFDFEFNVPGGFAQVDLDARPWLSISSSARVDAHDVHGTSLSPRVSLLTRLPSGRLPGWTTRLSVGAGSFAPTPFTEETEATGLTPLLPLMNLRAERATSGSLDVGGPIGFRWGDIELNATLFASEVSHPLQVIPAAVEGTEPFPRFRLVNAPGRARTRGTELLARLTRPIGESSEAGEGGAALRVTATYAYLRAAECDPEAIAASPCPRRELSLTPRHSAAVVGAIEREGHSRLGVELYYTGRQALADNPYRTTSRPYLIVGMLGERIVATALGAARLFLNLENITNVRQTRFDPLIRPSPGAGRRWTTDAWTELTGFTVNGGMRLALR
jgi:outer membrane receptor for ferrienterochelin and colicins